MRESRLAANVAVLVFSFVFSDYAQSVEAGSPMWPALTVEVAVNAQDERIGSAVERHIKTELASLPDVKIVQHGADWRLNILALEVSASGAREPIGVVLSVAVLEALPDDLLPGDTAEVIKALSWFQGHLLRTGTLQDLRQLCTEIVATFDSTHLQGIRKLRSEMLGSRYPVDNVSDDLIDPVYPGDSRIPYEKGWRVLQPRPGPRQSPQ